MLDAPRSTTTADGACVMADPAYRKALGHRIKSFRKERDLTQKELAQKLDITFGQLNKYESGLNSPSPELLVLLAEHLHVGLDMLLTGKQPDTSLPKNTRLLERLRLLEQLTAKEQETVIQLIDAVIVKHRAESALRPID